MAAVGSDSSDEDILPSMGSFSELFDEGEQQAKKPVPETVEQSPSGSNSNTNSQLTCGPTKRRKRQCSSQEKKVQKSSQEESTEDDEDDSKPQILPKVHWSVRIRWKNETIRFRKLEGTIMAVIRNELSDKIGVRADNILILHEDSCDEVLDARLVKSIPFGEVLEAFEQEDPWDRATVKVEDLNPDQVLIKLQGQGGKRERCQTVIKKMTRVKQLRDDFIEKFGHHAKSFKLMFDGEDMDLNETPKSLDMENSDMVDVVEIV